MKTFTDTAIIALVLASMASADDIRHTIAIVENPAADYLSICGSEFDVEGGGYSTCTIDIDGDGRPDQMFANAGTSGTGGQAATVYLAREDGRFSRIGTLGHGAVAAETIKTGARLLHCSWSFGGGSTSITTYLISHDGLTVLMSIGGEHDDEEYQKRFEFVFKDSLKPEYKFVTARPESKKHNKSEMATPRKPSD